MATLDVTAFQKALKVLYPLGLEEMWYADCPFLAWMPKSENFGGDTKQLNPLYAGIRGSNTFSTALNGKTTPALEKFNVSRVKTYVVGSIDNEAMMASRSNAYAVAEAVKTSMDGALYEFGRAAAHQAWHDKGGNRGQIGSISTDTVTLKDVNDVVYYEKDMVVEASANDGTAAGHALRAGTLTVKSVDRDNGKVTFTQNVTTGIPAAVANDYLFRQGDFKVSMSGVLGWIPATAPTAGDSFFGVDRSVDVARLAGTRITGAASIEETVFDAEAQLVINGGRADTLWLHPKRFAELKKSIQSKAWYAMENVSTAASKANGRPTKVGIHGFAFPGEHGPIVVMSDKDAPNAYGLLTRKAAWELSSLGPAPHFAEQSGSRLLVETSSDGVEYRLKAYWNILCKRPIDCALIKWA